MLFLYAIAAAIITILAHWASQFVLRSMGTLSRFVLVFLGIGLLLLLSAMHCAMPFADGAAMLLWFGFLCELYVFLFTLALSSISVKILQLLRQRPLSHADIAALYQPGSMVSKRFERLTSAGLLQGEAPTFTLTAKGHKLVRVFNFIRNLFHARG